VTLGFALFVHALTVLLTVIYLRLRVEQVLSVFGLALMALCAVHGIPVSIYLLMTGPETLIFETVLSKVDRASAMSQVPLSLGLMFSLLIVGAETARLALGSIGTRLSNQSQRKDKPASWARCIKIGYGAKAILWLVTLGMLTVSNVEGHFGKIWNYFGSSESELEKILLRVEEGATPYYLYNLLLSSVAPFLAMVALCATMNCKKDYSLRLLATTLLMVVLLGKFGTLSKAPPVIFVLQVVFLFVLLRGGKFNFSMAIGMLLVISVLFGFAVNVTIPDIDSVAIFKFLYYRVFDIPNEVLLEYFAAIPQSLSHGYGAGIFPFLREDGNSQYIPAMSSVAELSRGSLISTSNSLFIGDAWADFGWIGVASFSFLAGFLLFSYDRFAFRNGYTDEAACLVAGGAYGIVTLMSTALNTALITGGLVLLPILAFGLINSAQSSRYTHRPTVSAAADKSR